MMTFVERGPEILGIVFLKTAFIVPAYEIGIVTGKAVLFPGPFEYTMPVAFNIHVAGSAACASMGTSIGITLVVDVAPEASPGEGIHDNGPVVFWLCKTSDFSDWRWAVSREKGLPNSTYLSFKTIVNGMPGRAVLPWMAFCAENLGVSRGGRVSYKTFVGLGHSITFWLAPMAFATLECMVRVEPDIMASLASMFPKA